LGEAVRREGCAAPPVLCSFRFGAPAPSAQKARLARDDNEKRKAEQTVPG